MTTLSPDERASELGWIARLVFAAGLLLAVCGATIWGFVASDHGCMAYARNACAWHRVEHVQPDARYGTIALGEDLVFRAAPPMP